MERTPGEEGVAAARLEAKYAEAAEKLRAAEMAGDVLMIGVWNNRMKALAEELKDMGIVRTTDRPPDEELLAGED